MRGVRPRLAEIHLLGDGWTVVFLCPGWSVSSTVDELKRMGWRGRITENDVIEIKVADNQKEGMI